MIDNFDGDYWFLSNFYPSPVIMYGEEYPTVEHAFQAAKCRYPGDRLTIRVTPYPSEAKRIGRQVALVDGWDEMRIPVMTELVRRKFSDPVLRQRLVNETAGHDLVEGNTWGDRFWGVYRGVGENHLGKILMKIREEVNT